MFQTIVDVADNFQKSLADMIDGNENFELRDVLSRFTTDVIGKYFLLFYGSVVIVSVSNLIRSVLVQTLLPSHYWYLCIWNQL